METTSTNYTTGKEFLGAVDQLNQYLDRRANAPLMTVIQSEVRAYGDALRFELHQKLEKTVKATETERLQAMADLELRITTAIAENTKQDKIRGRWLKGAVTITIANLIALSILVIKLKGLL